MSTQHSGIVLEPFYTTAEETEMLDDKLIALLYLCNILCECDISPLSAVLDLIVNNAYDKQVLHSYKSLV